MFTCAKILKAHYNFLSQGKSDEITELVPLAISLW